MTDPLELGKYVIEARLGKGAMGVVYRGFDPAIGRPVALKTIRNDILGEDRAAEVLARFKREAQAAGQLSHPNIVTVYEYGEDNGMVYIAMEYVEGRDLKEILNRGERFGVSDSLHIMCQLLDALAYSHRHGVVHRDIKPANIILLADGTIKITDFGIAHVETSNLTQHGEVMGTPAYMSPEQCRGDVLDSRTDIFSAGVIMYQLLTAEKPFPGTAMTTIMHRVVNVEPLLPSELNCSIPQDLNQCVIKALAKNPSDRFQTAKEFLAAILAVDQTQFAKPAPHLTREISPAAALDQTLLADLDTVTIDGGCATVKLPSPAEVRQGEDGVVGIWQHKGVIGVCAAAVLALVLTVAILVKGPEHSPVPAAEAQAAAASIQQSEAQPASPANVNTPAKRTNIEEPAKEERSTTIHLSAPSSKGRNEASASSSQVRGIRPRVRD